MKTCRASLLATVPADASVIKAIAAAKVVAASIDEYLGFRHEISW